MMSGSSPLTRGKLDPHPRGQNHRRLIPAHTGKTLCDRLGAGVSGAHPRSRGENLRTTRPCFLQVGSSPLTRGKLLDGVHNHAGPGLIPAHAGKTSFRGVRWLARWAHPRSHGENFQSCVASFPAPGSSPLTRGKLLHENQHKLRVRLIPTHAGKTRSRRPFAAWRWAHPHSRGKNRAEKAHPAFQKGSSPPTRGKQHGSQVRQGRDGFIPTHAGKTCSSCRPQQSGPAHPRSREENTSWATLTFCQYGSSPLTRGNHDEDGPRIFDVRFIPAHAGKNYTS